VFLAYGSGTIRVVELTPDAQGVLPGGLDAVIIENADIGGEGGLPAEGSHFHKIDGKYFLFLIAWPASGSKRRVQLCYRSERIEGPYEGRVVLDDNMGYGQSGVAQGGIVDTPDGDWYAVLFQDRGAVGRVPVIVPLIWRDDWPILGTDGRAPMDVRMTLKPVADNLFAPDEFYPCHGTRDYSARNETGYLYKHFRRCSEREDGETEEELLTNNSFRDGLAGWETMEIAAIETETGDPPGGEPVLYVTGRKTTASGPRQIITGKTKHGGVYEVYARVKYDSGPIEKQFNICIRNGTDWQGIQIMASGMLTKGEWGEIKGAYTMPEDADMSETSVFIETIWAEKPNEKTDLMDFCVDSVSVIAKPLPKRTKTDAGENDVCAPGPAPWWQWNHNPDHNLWSLDERPGYLRLRTKYLNKGLLDARNTLTRRTFGPACAGVTALETDGMRNGDAAGLAAFQELYGFVGVKVINGEKYIVMENAASGEAAEVERFRLEQSRVYLRADFDFGGTDEARFSYSLDGLNWKTTGGVLAMQYKLSHFTGYRFALFYYATQIAGGYADFDYFRLSGETLRHDEALKILNVYIEGDEEIDGIKNCEAEVSICLDALPEGEYKGIYISALLPNILNVTGVEFCLDNIVGKPSFSVEGERLLMEVTGGAVYFSNNGSNLFAKLRLTCGQYATEDGEISLRVDYVHVDGGNVAYRVHDACARIKVKRVDTGAAAKLPGFANPLISHKYGADPWALEYGGRLYLYFTGDRYEYDEYGNLLENTYLKINTIGVISSSDLLNWTDHGEIAAAGVIGAAKWAEHSWAPAVAYKNIDGEDKFFLYFANDASNIGVLKADSPAGPWFDPIGKPLIHRGIKGIEDVAWCFDPAVLVDDDGEGYLYFGGGLPSETPEDALHPDTARVIKLGSDMISTAGEAVRIDAPAFFEDSGIHKYNGRYYYSYCSNFTGPHPAGYPGCGEIAYMTSDSPMGPFAFEDTLLKNPMDFFGVGGNNHHCIFAFKGEWYIAYHAQTLGKALGKQKGYRSPHINRLSYSSDGRIRPVKADMKGVTPIAAVNPYERVEAETFAWCAGISVSSSAPPDGERRTGLFVTHIHDGDWLAVANVDFGEKGASSLFAEVASPTGGKIEIRLDSPIAGEIIGTLAVGATGGEESWSLRQCALKPIKGVYDVFFVFRGDGEGELFNFGYWTVE
jgi:beta-xylosidase